jgi:hypothetical protein
MIMANLESQIATINQTGIPGEVWIDGSLLTEKLNPEDADIIWVLQRSTYLTLSPPQRQHFDAFRSQWGL